VQTSVLVGGELWLDQWNRRGKVAALDARAAEGEQWSGIRCITFDCALQHRKRLVDAP
jgi:hypothetical protein